MLKITLKFEGGSNMRKKIANCIGGEPKVPVTREKKLYHNTVYATRRNINASCDQLQRYSR
jgi:hypothetical protein